MTKNSKKTAGLPSRPPKIVKKKPVKKSVSKSSKKRASPFKKPRVSRPLLSIGRLETSSKKIAIAKKADKSVNINIVVHPLDVYQSPHLLDLSQSRFIEKVRPSWDGGDFSYNDLPGGALLAKLYIFELLSFDKSEIINGFKKLFNGFVSAVKKPFQRVNFSAKLPLVNNDNLLASRLSFWQEITFINLMAAVFSGLLGLGQNIRNLAVYLKQNQPKTDDEIDFGLKPSGADDLGRDYSLAGEILAMVRKPVLNIESKPVLNQKKFLPSLSFKIFAWPELKSVSFRGVMAFVIIALLIVLPIKAINYWQAVNAAKGRVLGEAEQAMQNLSLAQNQLANFNFNQSENYFSSAGRYFVSAQSQLNEIKSFLTVLAESAPVSNSFRSGKNLLSLGEHLANAGEYLLEGINGLAGGEELKLTAQIKNFKTQNNLALNELKLAQDNLKKVNLNHLPAENRDKFISLRKQLPIFMVSLEKIGGLTDFAVKFLGDNDLKRYLMVFQNDNELRATGGFMGSFALVDLESGKIKDIKIPAGGTYDVRAGFNELIRPPQPMQLLTPRWEFQDANWWPDWPTSAKSITWFYQKSQGPTIDGVIAINSDWLESLLGIVGPIDLPEYKKTITAANFEDEVQKEVEITRQNDKQPKKILADLAPKLLDKIFNIQPENILNLISAINSGLNQKDILIYLSDPQLENFVAQNSWDGRLKNTESDYLNVVATNIGGGKTDRAVKQKIYHRAEILADGSVIDRLLISRSHFGPIDENFTTMANRSYLRLYVPEGSQLIKAAGFVQPLAGEFRAPEYYLKFDERLAAENKAKTDPESKTKIYNENGKTVFANWLSINPGESKDVLLVYKLPFKINLAPKENNNGLINKIKAAFLPSELSASYGLLIQKQPGSDEDEIVSEVAYPDGFKPSSTYPQASASDLNKIIFRGKLTTDQYYFSDFK